MSSTTPRDPDAPAESDIDDQGVDRAQIREMLALSPLERLRCIEEYVAAAVEICARSAGRPLR
jgi:hypothetical protein